MTKLKRRVEKAANKLLNYFYIYRYDLFALALMTLAILYYVSVLFQPGHVVFSDIDFPFYSRDYMDEVYGLWNTRWNTVSMLNIPRLFFIMPLYLLSGIFGWNGHLFLKGFIFELILFSAVSMYLLSKRLVSVYMGAEFNLWKINALIFGGVFYALNPWLIYRIQHIYLLTGYSLFPLVILYFFKVFDHKFQKQFIPEYSPYTSRVYPRNLMDIFLLSYLITMSSAAIHYFFYSVLVLGILYMLLCVKYFFAYFRKGKLIIKNVYRAIIKKSIIFAFMMMGLSFYWLSIYVGGILFDVGASQHNINVIDTYTMFSRHASLGQVVLMLGYWWPMADLSSISPLFYVGGGVIVAFVLLGIVFNARKHHIVLFLTILAVLLTIISTGVYYPSLSGTFLRLANLPAFGNIFRDPNKMIGLTAISYSVLLIFGLESIYSITAKSKYQTGLNVGVFILLILSFYAYLAPIRNIYFDRFFQPIEEPVAFEELRNYYEDRQGDYAIYVPVAEQMLRPIVHISTPKWNTPEGYSNIKATGDIHIYNSPVHTVFHHEGNDPSIKFMYDMIQLLLDQGRSTHVDKLVRAFGVNQLIYHNEYLEQEIRQDFNEEILDIQPGLVKDYENDIFSVYNVPQNRKEENFNHRRLFTPYGLIKLNSLSQFDTYDPLELPLIFMSKEEQFHKEVIQEGDIVEMQSVDDLILPSLDAVYKLYPFRFVHEVNPFIKWSKTYTTFYDWAWIQTKLDVIHPNFDWDHDNGMVLTFASEAFDITPHKKKLIEGEVVYDFDSLLRADSFFIPDNPDLFEVISNPYNMTENVGVLHGVIQKGEPSFIWQVAKSPILTAEEKMPYQFKILVSGRGANKLHMKARFYDKNKREIGIQYVVGPDEFMDFDTVDFTGEVVTPKDTAFFRIDLLTYQRPESKIYWWIHDVEIKKFPQYTKPNSIEMTMDAVPGTNKVFIKHFNSVDGGIIQVDLGEASAQVDTKTTQLSGFKWTELGAFEIEDPRAEITLTNISGFNAVQQLVVIPESVYEEELAAWKKILSGTDQVLLLETESDFNRKGNIQSRRLYPELSYGTGTALSQGSIDAEFEIVTPGFYDIQPVVYFKDRAAGKVTMKIINAQTDEIVYAKDISERMDMDKSETVTVEFEPLGKIYPFETIDKNRPYKYMNSLNLDDVPLNKGKYTIMIEVDSENENYAKLESFKTFDPNSVITQTVLRDQAVQDCSTCERITPDMMRHFYLGENALSDNALGDNALGENALTIEFDHTCSCDWYISSSDPIEVDALDELLISFRARSDAITKRHSKLVFLDKYNQVLDTAFIFEVEEQDKVKWNDYEQLVRVPEGAETVLYQFWARGHKTRMGKLEIENFKLEKYKELVLIDAVRIQSSGLNFDTKDMNPKLDKNNKSEMTFEHKVTGAQSDKTVWNSFLSPHRIWKVNGEKSELTLNGVTMGFVPEDGKLSGSMTLGRVYQFGLLLHIATIVAAFGLYKYRRKKG